MKNTLITAVELSALAAEHVLIIDCRFDLSDPAKGERDFAAGHIPSAVYASLDRDLSDLTRVNQGLGRHPLPTEAAFSKLLSEWGWKETLQIVCYDAANGALAAARMWWLLRLAKISNVAVLDGGVSAWVAAGLPLNASMPARQATSVSVHFDAAQVVLDHATLNSSEEQVLLDARASPRYRGEVEPIDPVGGHVPGALNRPFSDNLAVDGMFKSPETLREEFRALLGTQTPSQVIHMCGSGVTACHNALAMEYAGLHGSRLYAPSWSGWVSDPSREVAQGA